MEKTALHGSNLCAGDITEVASRPLIVNLAATGMVPTRNMSPHVPISVDEIVADVCGCIDLGVSMAHLHARGRDERPTCDNSVLGEIIAGIRAKHPDVVIVTTTSGRNVGEIEQRASSLYLEGGLKPDMASLTLSSLNFSREASTNSPSTILRLAEIMKERGIKPELEVFDLGMVNFGKHLIDKGLIEPPFYFNILLGNLASAQLNMLQLAAIINELPHGSYWSLAGIGRFQAQANALGAVIGYGVRTGLEDNLWLDGERRHLATNSELVARCVRVAASIDRPIATSVQVRSWLGLEV